MIPCRNTRTHRITFTKLNKVIEKCKDCFEQFQIISKGHEDEFKVELIQN